MRTWREAMGEALYGPGGFYRRTGAPSEHFRTPGQSPVYALAVARLLTRVDDALGRPPVLDLVDVGAGRGELLRHIASQPSSCAARLRLTGVEIAERPVDLPAEITWTTQIPPVTGLLLATEWLDVVPLDVVEQTADGLRLVLVDATGHESLGAPPGREDVDWLQRWWPLTRPGDRAEIGLSRDRAWAAAVGQVRTGLALAVDYGHDTAGRPPGGTLTGFRAGREVPPVPDGRSDLTAHVALDSAAAAAGPGRRRGQAAALRELGTSGEVRPGDGLRGLQAAGDAADLLDPAGFGRFGWLLHGVGMEVPLGSGRT